MPFGQMQFQAPEDPSLVALLITLGVNAVLLATWAYRRYVLGVGTFARAWSLVDVWAALQLAVLLILVFMMPVLLVVTLTGADLVVDPADLRVLPLVVIQNIALFVAPTLFIVLKYRQRLRDIGLPRLPAARDWYAGIIIGLAIMAVVHVLGSGIELVARQFEHVEWVANALRYEETNPIAELTRALPDAGFGFLIMALVTIGISAPFGEEMFARGFLFRALRHRFGITAGLLGSALLFTLPHSYALGLVPVFLMGLALAWIYHCSGSLWTAIIVHGVNNSIAVVVAYFFPEIMS